MPVDENTPRQRTAQTVKQYADGDCPGKSMSKSLAFDWENGETRKNPEPLSGSGFDSGTDQNRRMSVPLSPTLVLFSAPHGKLYLKLKELLRA